MADNTPKLITEAGELRLTVDPPPIKIEIVTSATRLHEKEFKITETGHPAPDRAEVEARLRYDDQRKTDEADAYLVDKTWVRQTPIGMTTIDVLHTLVGQPWDARALNIAQTVRPSVLRVIRGASVVTDDTILWRVTVYLAQDDRTISNITQEVEVGLRGWRYGADASAYLQGYETWPQVHK